MTAAPKSELMARLREKRRADGLREVTVWVPEDRVDDVKDFAASLCDEDH